MSFEPARRSMITNQLKPWGVQDERILSLMEQLPREHFVPAAYKAVAYADTEIPIGHGQVLHPPKWAARALDGLALRASDSVLKIGTGTGYLTDCFAHLCFSVVSLEIYEDFHLSAKKNLQQHAATNVDLYCEDGRQGFEGHAPYDVIYASSGFSEFPGALAQQLAPGGRLFVVLGTSPAMQACVFTRCGQNDWSKKILFDADIPAVVSDTAPAFNF